MKYGGLFLHEIFGYEGHLFKKKKTGWYPIILMRAVIYV